MGTVAKALIAHEFMERTRDRWVLVVSLLFALLAMATALYGRGLEEEAAALTGPSLVTLISLLVPLVGLVLGHDAVVGERERNTLGLLLSLPTNAYEVMAGKFLGRLAALTLATGLGLGLAILVAADGQGAVLAAFFFPMLILGAAFLSLGMFLSAVLPRQSTVAGVAVGLWFALVFFYDLGLLGILVATDGAVSQNTIAGLVFANPAGLFRMSMLEQFAGSEALEGLGVGVALPGTGMSLLIWSLWVLLPAGVGAWILAHQKVMK